MTSIVDTSVKHFFSSMVGAPVLKKAPGSLIALLDAVLVLGFDNKPATGLTIAGGVATLAFAGTHSATVHSVVTVSGVEAPYAALNGEQKVTAIAGGKVSFATAANAGTATGSIAFKMASAGWEKRYTKTNVAVYRSLDPKAHGHMIRVDDTGDFGGPNGSRAGHARVRGFETMSDVDTGTGVFPTNQQIEQDPTNGGYWPKAYDPSTNVDSYPIGWSFYADSRIFYFAPMAYQGDTSNPAPYLGAPLTAFGDLLPLRPAGDPYATGLTAGTNTSGAQSYPRAGSANEYSEQYGGMFVPRRIDGSGTSQRGATYCYAGANYSDSYGGAMANNFGPFPNPVDGSLLYAPRFFRGTYTSEADLSPRADVPGIVWIPMSGVFQTLGVGKIIDGEGKWAGRKLYGHISANTTTDVNGSNTQFNVGVTLIDLTGPWR